jgi:hypothetical protein
MPGDTQTPVLPPKNPSQPGTAAWLYDEVVRFIEPDLMSDRIVLARKWRDGETDVTYTERQARYDRAKAAVEEAMRDIAALSERDGTAMMQELRRGAEQADDEQRDQDLSAIDQAMDEASKTPPPPAPPSK